VILRVKTPGYFIKYIEKIETPFFLS